MTESDAKTALNVPRGTLERIEKLVDLVTTENLNQNLISVRSRDEIWQRHVLDSAQLTRLAPEAASWLDIGSGGGFPGLLVAMLQGSKVTLVEPRRLRAEFLVRAITTLGIRNAEVVQTKVERLPPGAFDVISARAVASLDRLFAMALPFSRPETRWILPKGSSAQSELEAAEASWQGEFRLEPSLTDPDARIVVATGVRRKAEGKRAR
jgi:16S rRNA (guanine527-N7)-methyltransferase